MYEKTPPMDSPSWNVPGRNAVCAPISTCPFGKYLKIPANDTADVTCANCPVGMYKGNSSFGGCRDCPAGKYSDIEGARSCKTCTNCLSSGPAPERSKFKTADDFTCPFANASMCRMAFEALCSKEADASCMLCPVASTGWDVNSNGVCTSCM